MIGRRKPIAELVVAPRKVIAVPIFVTGHATAPHTTSRISVSITFCLPVRGLPMPSSIESLEGRIVNGLVQATTTHMEIKAI